MESSLFCYSACLILIVTGLICSVIRWCHMCHPYNQKADYFYPSRKCVTAYFLSTLFLFPYLLHRDSPDTWLFVRCFFILYIPSFGGVSLRNYFSCKVKYWWMNLLLVNFLPGLTLLTLFIFACIGGDYLMPWHDWVVLLMVVFSLFVVVHLMYVTQWLAQRISDYQHGEYSNEENFPVRFAQRIVFIPLILWLFSMGVFLTDNPEVNALFNLVLSIFGIRLLLFILPSHRAECHSIESSLEDTVDQSQQEGKEVMEVYSDEVIIRPRELSETLMEQLEEKIRHAIVGEKLYLDPNFNKKDLVRRLGTNRTYLSIVFRERLSSFYDFVNTLRIEHAIRYREAHPEASQLEVAVNSGFGTVRTYNRVKKMYAEGKL